MDGRKVIGSALVFLVALIWILASFVVADLSKAHGVSFVMVTYISNSTFLLYLPFVFRLRAKARARVVKAAAVISPLWLCAQLTFNWSLALTSVPSNTILSTTSCLFALLISTLLLHERLSLVKMLSACATIAGTTLVTISDWRGSGQSIVGDVLAIASAAIYACHSTLLKRLLTDGESSNSTEEICSFFALVGACNVLLGAPVMVGSKIAGTLNVGKVTVHAAMMCIGKGVLVNVVADALWAKAVTLTSPTFASIGTSLDVPMSVIIKAMIETPEWLESTKAAVLKFTGAAVVLSGFFGINSSSSAFACNTGTDGSTKLDAQSEEQCLELADRSNDCEYLEQITLLHKE